MQLIKLKEVINKTCLSRSSIYDYVDRGLFPKPVKLGARSITRFSFVVISHQTIS